MTFPSYSLYAHFWRKVFEKKFWKKNLEKKIWKKLFDNCGEVHSDSVFYPDRVEVKHAMLGILNTCYRRVNLFCITFSGNNHNKTQPGLTIEECQQFCWNAAGCYNYYYDDDCQIVIGLYNGHEEDSSNIVSSGSLTSSCLPNSRVKKKNRRISWELICDHMEISSFLQSLMIIYTVNWSYMISNFSPMKTSGTSSLNIRTKIKFMSIGYKQKQLTFRFERKID